MNNAKIWILITGIVVIGSAALLYSMIRSREIEKAAFIVQIQELNGRLSEIERLKTEMETLKKDKTEAETKMRSEVSALEEQLGDSKKNEALFKSKVDALLKEKESLSKYVENNTAIVAKLNKKIEALEKERDQALSDSRNDAASAFSFVDPMNENPASSATVDMSTPKTPMGAKLANEEIVDLGRIIVHATTHEAARVEHVNPLYGFIVLSAGSSDGLRKDSVVNITRNNRLVAKAVVKKAREDVATAVTLPEWTREEIRVGDLVSINTPSALPIP